MPDKKIQVAISSDFLTSFAALPRQAQGKVTEFINKFRSNPASPGIHYEKINSTDKKFCSVRIDDTYRGIIVREEETGVYLLLWVDHHDEAYAWAKNKQCTVNRRTGAIQVYDKIDTQETKVQNENTNKLFENISDKELFDLGLPEEQLNFVRTITDTKDFYSRKKSFSNDTFEKLSWIAEGFPLSEVIEMLKSEQEESTQASNLAEALMKPQTLNSFVVVEGEDDLKQIMAEPLEKWRVFLHPTQRKIVNKSYSGEARVLGGAGTGKTVVAMHRAKYLASKLKDKEKILFTTFTANLASDIKDNLRKICSIEELRRIEVINLDAWVIQYLREQGYSYEILYDDEKIKDMWTASATESDYENNFPISFYEEEWNRVVAAQEAFTVDKYIKASRTGRGTRLDRRKRIQIWKVFENYQNIMKDRRIKDINTAMYECKLLVEKSPSNAPYKHIIVDEGQDLSPNALRLLRALAGTPHPNDIFIVGDSRQRIYKNRASLSKCGINIRGRSSILRINYRTTEEIRKSAFALLKGIPFDDLDDSIDTSDNCRSLTHGQAPEILKFKTANEEFDFLINKIKELNENGIELNNICVVARTHSLLDDYIEHFSKNGIRAYEIRSSKNDNRSYDGLRIATMHRVKGLEFQYVFIAAVNKHIVPLESVIYDTDDVSINESITAEKCLLYVAMTRAQKGTFISCYGQPSEFIV